MEKFITTAARIEDSLELQSLYRAVAAIKGGLARTIDEITENYIHNFLSESLESGIIVVARDSKSGQIIGEIHSYALGPKVFAHVLGELTIAVHPEYQGIGIGRAIFTEFLKRVVKERPDILRVELIAQESNQKAIEFYQKLGFEIEGRMVNRIRSVSGGYEADIPMAWHRKTVEQS